MGPLLRSRTTRVMASSLAVRTTSAGQFSRAPSQAASRSSDVCRFCPSTVTDSTGSNGGCSTAAAMSARHSVTRAHARSVSPGAYVPARLPSISCGCFAVVLSMIRRVAMAPTGSCDGTSGASRGHQATIGASGSRSGITSVSARSRSGPEARSTTTSEAPASPPTRICASRCVVLPLAAGATTMTRHGCSRLASLAASTDSSMSPSSASTTRVSTRPRATAPPSSRRRTRRLLTWLVVVSGMSMITVASRPCRRAPSWRRPTADPRCRKRRAPADPCAPSRT